MPRRLPRQQEPRPIAREYARTIRDYVFAAEFALRPLLDELPSLLRRAALERRDADEGRRIRELVETARRRMESQLQTDQLDRIVTGLARRVTDFQREQLLKQLRAATGIDVLVSDAGLASQMEAFAAENAALIRDVPTQVIAKVEQASTRAVASGTLHRDLAKELDDIFAFGRDRSRLIARDQVGKLYGQANKTRQRNTGINKYIWRTSNDRRVRGTPGGAYPNARYSHYNREGDTFSWDNPPADGHPGEPILCRCYGEPVIDPAILGA